MAFGRLCVHEISEPAAILGFVRKLFCCGLQLTNFPTLPVLRSFFLASLSSCGSAGKESACNAGDLGSIPGWGRSPGDGNGNPLQYCCLENCMNGGAWWATVHGVSKSRTRLSDFTFTFSFIERLGVEIGTAVREGAFRAGI